MSGDEECLTVEDCVQLAILNNRKLRHDIGTIKIRISDNECHENGVSTTFSFNVPLKFHSVDCERIHIASYVIGYRTAETRVIGYSPDQSFRSEQEITSLRKNYHPSQLPSQHERIVQQIETLHAQFYKSYMEKLEKQGVDPGLDAFVRKVHALGGSEASSPKTR